MKVLSALGILGVGLVYSLPNIFGWAGDAVEVFGFLPKPIREVVISPVLWTAVLGIGYVWLSYLLVREVDKVSGDVGLCRD